MLELVEGDKQDLKKVTVTVTPPHYPLPPSHPLPLQVNSSTVVGIYESAVSKRSKDHGLASNTSTTDVNNEKKNHVVFLVVYVRYIDSKKLDKLV